MLLTGKLRTWNEDRGYGFIAPTGGGRELFVHISAFRDGGRPTVGETITYEMGAGRDGKPAAVNVHRRAWGSPSEARGSERSATTRRSLTPLVVGVLLVLAIAGYAYRAYQRRGAEAQPSVSAPHAIPAPARQESAAAFRCDGRKYCSQMTSCTEAKFFLKNCPGTQMDGNNDGVPCEQQWCTRPVAR